MKKLFCLVALILPILAYAQDASDVKPQTKYEQIFSQTGRLVKFQDFKLASVPVSMATLKACVRVIFLDEENLYFLRLEKPETSSSIERIAMIEYSDLVEVNKALVKLSESVDDDLEAKPDYLENKFTTTDGFAVGYYISPSYATGQHSVNWYIKLERYSKSTVFPKSQGDVLKVFSNAKAMIEKLQKQNGQRQ